MATDDFKVPVENLRWVCDTDQFDFETTDDLPELEDTIGQERALRSIDLSLGMSKNGYNLYISGEAGTGRTTSIMKLLKKRAKGEPAPPDWCYVHNFKSPDNPIALALNAGMGNHLEKDMQELLSNVRADIPKALESKDYENQKSALVLEQQEKNNTLFSALEQEAKEQGFSLQRTVTGLVMIPQKEDRNYTQEEYEALPLEEQQKIDKIGNALKEKLADLISQIRENEKLLKEALARLDRSLVLSAVGHYIEPLKTKYVEFSRVLTYLDDVQEDILLNLEDFKGTQQQPQLPGVKLPAQAPSFERYTVNLFVDNCEQCGAPVVFEANPTYNNLFGRIDHVMQVGGLASTNFSLIKPGALHKANGGYLVVNARDILTSPFSWEALKRTIRNSEIKIEDVLEQYRIITVVSLKPEPIPMQAKIIMIGSPWIYYLLFNLEPDYRKFFKVKADFDSRVTRTPEIIKDYGLFISSHCNKEKLRPFDKGAVAGIIEYSSRMVEDQNKFSTQFMEIADLIREADFWAGKEGSETVTRAIIKQAIEEKIYRSNQVEERLQELITDGTIMVDTEGSEVGQVNGLSVMTLGDYAFGKPSRVTARVFMGKSGMVNIEREVKLSGPIHDKGVLILSGYLGGKFAHDKPLSFSASICFEQSYGGIDGDSASSTELYALLSALSGIPLNQGIAVTGSVNQLGKVQPIGGVNFKIEGFFAVCKAKGLNGTQGVLIPRSNLRNLMLKDEVVDAISAGKFHIWSAETIDQGIEILTGLPAGGKGPDGKYPEGTINQKVDMRLREILEDMKHFSGGNGKDEKKEVN